MHMEEGSGLLTQSSTSGCGKCCRSMVIWNSVTGLTLFLVFLLYILWGSVDPAVDQGMYTNNPHIFIPFTHSIACLFVVNLQMAYQDSAYSTNFACNSGLLLTGGGCLCANGSIIASYPSMNAPIVGSALPVTSWNCQCANPSPTDTVYVVCLAVNKQSK
jgi:hypothetical protein